MMHGYDPFLACFALLAVQSDRFEGDLVLPHFDDHLDLDGIVQACMILPAFRSIGSII